jgi:4-hydroxy-3-polyprenylbenzoate decarboxylase
MPAFYHKPQSINELVTFMIGKILDIMKIPNETFTRYE